MCGINGIFRFNGSPATTEELSLMNSMMIHRGPDDEGLYTDRNFGLSIRRLSIIDIRGGHQPISNEDGRYHVVLNGEIYNYLELREELTGRGHIFRTKTDTEVLVHLYEDAGEKCLERLNGMFAFAIWDLQKRELFIANDRLGIKPLFFYKNGSFLGFSSELKSLMTLNFTKDIDAGSFLLYLFLLYVPYPRSIIKNVYKLEPATCMRVKENGEIKKHTYWGNSGKATQEIDSDGFSDIFLSLLSDSIRLQLRSDVPIGTFLSGGIDSSAVVGMLSKYVKGPIRTFSVGYEGNISDERPFALKVAKTFNTEHKELFLTADIIKENFRRIAWFMDEPIGDTAAVPNFLLSEMARNSGVKVILNGTGGDEIFGGYTRYLNTGMKGRLRNRLSIVVNSASLDSPVSLDGFRESLNPLLEYLCSMNGSLASVRQVLSGDRWGDELKRELISVFAADFNSLSRFPDSDKYMKFDIKTYLAGDLLFLLDKMSMAASVEGRVPLLDHRIVEFMSSIPSRIRIKDGNLKSLVKSAFKEILPLEILERKKMGFGGPVLFWLSKDVLNLDSISDDSSFCKKSGLINIGKVSKIIKNKGFNRRNAQLLYNLTVFELWYKDVFRKAAVN